MLTPKADTTLTVDLVVLELDLVPQQATDATEALDELRPFL